MTPLRRLARAAGLETEWQAVDGAMREVSEESLAAVLAALGLPAGSEAQIAESAAALRDEVRPPLVTATIGERIAMQGSPGRYQVRLESGASIDGIAEVFGAGVSLPAIMEAGYHRLEFDGQETVLALAPRRAFTLEDAAQGQKLWGLTVQLYGLRRLGDGGIGDFKALAAFGALAARHGAAALGISPVHALYSADVTKYGPYAPSNRAALNVLHVAEDSRVVADEGLINWPVAAAAKLKLLRERFDAGYDAGALARFRAEAGIGVERHAVFEALAGQLTAGNPAAQDWRHWPLAYQDPAGPAVARFVMEAPHEVAFHAWLQMRADAGLRDAQAAMKAAGAKIGLIADLAVGTGHAGSASWSRQDEVLTGLEIGAPPDLINREGQSWGITAFSPGGLRRNGFSAFLEMLRAALRHAGGVRIDHVMGLARLWVVPAGMASTQGAYLRLPVEDLMRLVVLESQRHKAVILGEDLGTLPVGFGERLNEAGIAGLRVMWFERDENGFRQPEAWTTGAVAMTTTHDLPTVAGWWEGRDISWREELGMKGETAEERVAQRTALQEAFAAAGAPVPAEGDGAAATYAAAAYLGRAACTLALLPVEDALSLPEQPNLPGTVDEHPNWRRRLPGDAEEIFARQDFAARLAVLIESRK